MNAADILLRSPSRAVALVEGTRVVGYGALRTRVAATAAGWRADGMAQRARCALVLDDGIDWVVAFLGLVWLGALPVPVCPDVEPAALVELAREHDVRWILAEDRIAALPALRRRPQLHVLGRTHWLGQQPPEPATLRAQPSTPQAAAWLRRDRDPQGRTALVPHAHQQMLADAQAEHRRETPPVPAVTASRLCEGGSGMQALFAGLGLGTGVSVGAPSPAALSRRATS